MSLEKQFYSLSPLKFSKGQTRTFGDSKCICCVVLLQTWWGICRGFYVWSKIKQQICVYEKTNNEHNSWKMGVANAGDVTASLSKSFLAVLSYILISLLKWNQIKSNQFESFNISLNSVSSDFFFFLMVCVFWGGGFLFYFDLNIEESKTPMVKESRREVEACPLMAMPSQSWKHLSAFSLWLGWR